MNEEKLHDGAVLGPSRISVCVLMTCFNRCATTLECLRALGASTDLEHVALHAVLVDDGSSDGTAQAVRAEFPWVDVVVSHGSLFWCRGMHLAFETALRKGFDHYVWLNDDTTLRPEALAGLLTCEALLKQRTDAPVIVVGNTVDPVTGAHTYGGERQPSRLASFRVERIAPGSVPQRCDTMTGNIVLIPAHAVARVGNLDPVFEHAMGDTDYALRARRLGVELWVAPHVHGSCAHNPVAGTYLDESLPTAERWKRMLHRKGLPWKSWLTFTRRHMGVMWPLYFAWPYAKLWVASGRSAMRIRPLKP
jgi:GT2 family glycosyltransferase